MCRAVWVIVVAPDETARSIRRAIGADAQVVLVTDDAADPGVRSTQADVLVVVGAMDGARDLVAAVRDTDIAVLWIGGDAPTGAHHAQPMSDDLSSAVTKALLSRRR